MTNNRYPRSDRDDRREFQTDSRFSRGSQNVSSRNPHASDRSNPYYSASSTREPISNHRERPRSASGHGNGYVPSNPRHTDGRYSSGHFSENPYLDQGTGDFGRVGSGDGVLKVGGMGSGRRPAPSRNRLIAIAVVAVVAVIGILYLFNRPVELTVNGSRMSIKVGTSLTDVVKAKGVVVNPGNLVSVNGNVITSGGGEAFSAKVGDDQLSGDQISSYKVGGGENIEVTDGADTMEDYDTSVVEEQPKLEMDGSYGAIGYISQWGKVGKQEVRTGKTSGETANGDVIQPVQNCVITLHNVTPDDGKKVVALTFDDGPSSYTSKYLDILNQYGIHATFFNLGQSVDEYPDESKAIVEQGSQLASHTYSHDDLPTDSSDKVLSEVTSAFTSIKNATGQDTTVIRPPYGDFKETTWSHTNGTMSTSVLWNMDSEDWRRPGADKIVSNACDGITSGDIILMHDGGGNRDQDVEALPKIIERLQGEGYTFVTVNELMASDSSIPDWCCTGNNPMPDDAVWPTEIA